MHAAAQHAHARLQGRNVGPFSLTETLIIQHASCKVGTQNCKVLALFLPIIGTFSSWPFSPDHGGCEGHCSTPAATVSGLGRMYPAMGKCAWPSVSPSSLVWLSSMAVICLAARAESDRVAAVVPPFLNPDLPPDVRAKDLVGRLNITEQVSACVRASVGAHPTRPALTIMAALQLAEDHRNHAVTTQKFKRQTVLPVTAVSVVTSSTSRPQSVQTTLVNISQ
jgi:hypothetical protein